MITTMPRLPDDRDRVDHVLATIDGALESYGDAMRWSPDPPEEREQIYPTADPVRAFIENRNIDIERILRSGQIGDYAGVPIMPEDRARDRMDRIAAMPITPIPMPMLPVRFDVTVSLDEINRSWRETVREARAAFDRITAAMTRLQVSANRLSELLQTEPGPIPREMPEHWRRAMAARARRGTGPTQTPWRHRNP